VRAPAGAGAMVSIYTAWAGSLLLNSDPVQADSATISTAAAAAPSAVAGHRCGITLIGHLDAAIVRLVQDLRGVFLQRVGQLAKIPHGIAAFVQQPFELGQA